MRTAASDVFGRENAVEIVIKNYNEGWIKRRAKVIRKAQQIPHHKALERASQEAGFQNWEHFLSTEPHVIPPSTLVRSKERDWLAIAVSQIDDSVICYTHWGIMHCQRREISICRDQTPAASFRPMRIVMPYGKWTCADGTEVLFNRDYRPIWKKHSNGMVVAADPDEWVIFTKQEFLFGDHNAPHEDRDSDRICTNQLRDWRVQHEAPKMLNLFREAVATGDLTRLDKKDIYDS
jgi:hypothetical protein